MPTAKVCSLSSNRIVLRSAEGREVEVPIHVWRAGIQGQARIGDEVEYVLEGRDSRRPRASRVWRTVSAEPAPPPKPAPEPPRPDRPEPAYRPPLSRSPNDGFLNPYNFVRACPMPPGGEPADPEARLLGRCPPPPRDRYVGLSGVLTCRITAEGPVFVSDSREVHAAGGEHRSYRFFRDPDGVPCIPASTLRGVVRSVFEAVTNSCWEYVADRRLSHRITARDAQPLVPARLFRQGDGWRAELLTGTTGYRPGGPKGNEPLYAAWVLAHRPHAHGRMRPRLPAWLRHGTEAWARVRKQPYQKTDRRTGSTTTVFHYWNVEDVQRDPASLQTPEVDGKAVRVVRGYYHRNGLNIEHKHDERFFFSNPENGAGCRVVEVSSAQVRSLLALLEDYRERRAREGARPERPGSRHAKPEPSRFVTDGPTDEAGFVGELVYAFVAGTEDAPEVTALAPVAVPRLFYDTSIGGRFPARASVTPCSRFNAAREGTPHHCPACRVFGWVARGGEGEAASGALRARVRFGDARFSPGDLCGESATLPILSAPKPTTVRFYLAPTEGDFRPMAREDRIGYDSPDVALRGRKFYRRQDEVTMDAPAAGNQNRTIRDYLDEGATSTFRVHFENLARVELGALVWALELDSEAWVHRLGYGKPLGMGDVRIVVEASTLFTEDRYAAEPGETTAPEAGTLLAEAKDAFRDALARRYDGSGATEAGFHALPNVQDLRAMLHDLPRLPVRYPLLPHQLQSGDEPPRSYEWFVVNRGAKGRGRGHWLDLAAEDHGLPNDPTAL